MSALTAIGNLDDKIADERATLLMAGRHIADGEDRLRRQRDLLYQMRIRKLDTCQGERLVDVLQATLEQWQLHRGMIIERLAYLEGQRQ
jgi:hypothetical protein